MTQLLKVENLNIKAGFKKLVKNVSFTLNEGETLCVVGESGSGKTLSALAVIGLLPESLKYKAETLVFNEHDLQVIDDETHRKMRGLDVGMIFQEPMTSLNPVLKVGDQIAEVFEVHTKLKKQEIKSHVLELLEKVKIDDPKRRYNAYPSQLSGGQRQRVMIAMALALKPKLLIADEPTTALDVTVQGEILKLIKDLQKEMNMAVMFITHDFGVVKEMADNVAVMEHGDIVEQGTVTQIMNKPKHAYTKKLLAAMPVLVTNKKPLKLDDDILLNAENIQKMFMIKKGGFFSKATPFYAVNNVSFQMKRGESIGIVGESGSGKSTLARCAIGLYQPDGGDIVFNGQNLTKMNTKQLRIARRDMQMVFQDPFSSLNPRMKIGESVAEGIKAHNIVKSQERRAYVEQLLEDCGLPKDSYDRYPHQFSGGQRQRICIARALALKPALIIADEAVSALDVSVQKQILELMDELKVKYNLSYLFISHDLRVVSQFCDKVLVMHKGELVEQGTISEVYTKPKQQYTKDLLAALPGV